MFKDHCNVFNTYETGVVSLLKHCELFLHVINAWSNVCQLCFYFIFPCHCGCLESLYSAYSTFYSGLQAHNIKFLFDFFSLNFAKNTVKLVSTLWLSESISIADESTVLADSSWSELSTLHGHELGRCHSLLPFLTYFFVIWEMWYIKSKTFCCLESLYQLGPKCTFYNIPYFLYMFVIFLFTV